MYEIEQLAILLHKACARKSVIDTLRVLENEAVNKRDLVNARDQNGKTPVMPLFDFRITKENIQDAKTIIEILRLKGADFNCRDRYNNTILHKIATSLHRVTNDKKLNMPLIKLILKYGADPSIKNKNGKTCYEIAYELNARKIGDFLNFSCIDHVYGGIQCQQPEFIHFGNRQIQGAVNLHNKFVSCLAYPDNNLDPFGKASAPPMYT